MEVSIAVLIVTLGSAAIAAGQGKEAERLAKEVPNEVLGTPEKGIPPDRDANTRIYGRKSDPKDILFKGSGSSCRATATDRRTSQVLPSRRRKVRGIVGSR
jgi:hypothetical protein